MCAHRQNLELADHKFSDLDTLLRAGDTLVLNQTKVLKARVFGQSASGRRFEVFLLGQSGVPEVWECLVRPGKHIKEGGTDLFFPGGMRASVCRDPHQNRQFLIRFSTSGAGWFDWLEKTGQVPLPPYLKREADESDAISYQTVYAKNPGSVAAPTAGLHFTPELLTRLKSRGIQIETLDLQIGYGTFSPIDPSTQVLHEEHYCISPATAQRLSAAREQGRRIVAVGTTALRALESAASGKLEGQTNLFIRPGYRFTQVDGLITNFHLPQSSLFILIAAFMGRENALHAYGHAIDRKYRFYSYGDAMLIL